MATDRVSSGGSKGDWGSSPPLASRVRSSLLTSVPVAAPATWPAAATTLGPPTGGLGAALGGPVASPLDKAVAPGLLEALAQQVLEQPAVLLAQQVLQPGPHQLARALELAALLLREPAAAGRRAG